MTNGVFQTDEQNAPETPKTPEIDPNIAKRLEDKDAFIAQLQAETAEMRAELERKAQLEEMLEEARRNAAKPPERNPDEGKQPAPESHKPLNEDELVERVLKAQEARTQEQRAQANVDQAAARLIELYGSEEAAAKVVADRASELNIGVKFLMDTAKQSPEAFYELMKLQTAPKQAPAPTSNVNTAALAAHAPGVKEGTNAYYEKLRNELGAAFYTPKIQNQRMKDRIRLGDAFYT